MLVLSVVNILEEATCGGFKHATGAIRDLEGLFEPENLARLPQFVDVLCFLAFDPRGDGAVADYVRCGTLPDDSGARTLVMFTLDEPAPAIVHVGPDSMRSWAEVAVGTHPVYQAMRALYPDRQVPPLPGLVLFDDLAHGARTIYIPLGHLASERDVRTCLRQVFSLVDHVFAKSAPGRFLDEMGYALRKNELAFQRTDRTPVREWLLRAIQFARRHRGDIVSAIGLLK